MKFNFRKIAGAASTLAMVGSTAALAMAASFPQPFVSSSGSADVAVVYGNSLDLSAVTDISAALNAATTTSTATSSGTTPDGDYVLLSKNSNKLNFGNMISDIYTSLDDSELPELLADGTYTADDNDDFDYTQDLTLPAWTLTHFRDSSYEDDLGLSGRTPTVGFDLSSSTFMMNYTLKFTSNAESELTSGDLTDFEGSDIPLMGSTYYISDAKNSSGGGSATYLGKLTLLDSATTASLAEGESTTLTVGGSTYDVSINFITTNSVKFDVNGEITNSLSEGQTFKLSDGTFIAPREISVQDYAGGSKLVEFSLGSGKLEITSGEDVKLNDDTIEGVKGYVYRGSTNGGLSIDKIEINWISDDDEWLSPARSLTMPGFEGFVFSMNELVRNDEEKVGVQHDSDTSIELTFPFKDGSESFNILYTNSTGEFTGIGKTSTQRLATSNSSSVTFYEKRFNDNYHEWFPATYVSGEDAESYLLSASITSENGLNRTTIKNEVTGNNECENLENGDDCDIGDVTLNIGTVIKNSTEESVVLTVGSASTMNFNVIYTAGGLGVYLPYIVANATVNSNPGAIAITAADVNVDGHSEDSFLLFMDGEDKDDTKLGGTQFNFTVNDNSDGEVTITQVNNAGSGGSGALETGEDSNVYEKYIVDDVAPRILHYAGGGSSDQDYAEVYYPTGESETHAEVFLAANAASGGSSSSGGLSVMDDELVSSGMSTKHLVVVGGTCVNSVAANLLGVDPSTCGAAWTAATEVGAGEYLIQTFANPWSSSKVATLVAGYAQEDTLNAATYLRTQEPTTDVGAKYTGTAATEATMVAG